MQNDHANSDEMGPALQREISVTQKVGRKPKINEIPPAVYTRMLRSIRIGVSDEVAATSIGINPGTFYRWMARGLKAIEIEVALDYDDEPPDDETRKWLESKLLKLDPDGVYRQFCEDVRCARAYCLVECEIRVCQQAPLTFLRRHDKRWRETGSDTQVNHTGSVNISGHIEHEVSSDSVSGLAAPVPGVSTILDVLQTWEELGLIELTEAGKSLFQNR